MAKRIVIEQSGMQKDMTLKKQAISYMKTA